LSGQSPCPTVRTTSRKLNDGRGPRRPPGETCPGPSWWQRVLLAANTPRAAGLRLREGGLVTIHRAAPGSGGWAAEAAPRRPDSPSRSPCCSTGQVSFSWACASPAERPASHGLGRRTLSFTTRCCGRARRGPSKTLSIVADGDDLDAWSLPHQPRSAKSGAPPSPETRAAGTNNPLPAGGDGPPVCANQDNQSPPKYTAGP